MQKLVGVQLEQSVRIYALTCVHTSYIHIYIHACMHAYIHTCIHTYIHPTLANLFSFLLFVHCFFFIYLEKILMGQGDLVLRLHVSSSITDQCGCYKSVCLWYGWCGMYSYNVRPWSSQCLSNYWTGWLYWHWQFWIGIGSFEWQLIPVVNNPHIKSVVLTGDHTLLHQAPKVGACS